MNSHLDFLFAKILMSSTRSTVKYFTNIATINWRIQGRWDTDMMSEYVTSLIKNDESNHKIKLRSCNFISRTASYLLSLSFIYLLNAIIWNIFCKFNMKFILFSHNIGMKTKSASLSRWKLYYRKSNCKAKILSENIDTRQKLIWRLNSARKNIYRWIMLSNLWSIGSIKYIRFAICRVY